MELFLFAETGQNQFGPVVFPYKTLPAVLENTNTLLFLKKQQLKLKWELVKLIEKDHRFNINTKNSDWVHMSLLPLHI